MDLFASRFETRRYLAMLGGTTEWSKFEGITFAPELGKQQATAVATHSLFILFAAWCCYAAVLTAPGEVLSCLPAKVNKYNFKVAVNQPAEQRVVV